jgi:hypothetical protein
MNFIDEDVACFYTDYYVLFYGIKRNIVGYINRSMSCNKLVSKSGIKERTYYSQDRLKLVYIIFFILLFSCKTEKSIFGIYSSENFGRIELKSDSTYKYRGGHLDLVYFSSGAWQKVENNSVFLNSTITNTTAQLFLTKNNRAKNNSKILKFIPTLVGDNDKKNYRFYLYIDNERYTDVRCDSLNQIDIRKQFSQLFIKINYEPLLSTSTAISTPIISEIFNFENTDALDLEFTVFIEKDKFFYKSFDSYLLNGKRATLYFMNEYTGKWEKLKKIN